MEVPFPINGNPVSMESSEWVWTVQPMLPILPSLRKKVWPTIVVLPRILWKALRRNPTARSQKSLSLVKGKNILKCRSVSSVLHLRWNMDLRQEIFSSKPLMRQFWCTKAPTVAIFPPLQLWIGRFHQRRIFWLDVYYQRETSFQFHHQSGDIVIFHYVDDYRYEDENTNINPDLAQLVVGSRWESCHVWRCRSGSGHCAD